MIKATVKLDRPKTDIEGDLLKALSRGFDDNIDRGFQRSQELILKQSFDEGILLRSGHIIKTGELERVISYEALHALFVEFGATYTDKMPPLQVIYEWVRRKKLQSKNPESLNKIKSWLKKEGIIESVKTKDSDYWAMAFYIAKDIKEHGLEPRPFMRPAVEEMKAHIEGDVGKRIKEMIK
jgi:hypothetical protein